MSEPAEIELIGTCLQSLLEGRKSIHSSFIWMYSYPSQSTRVEVDYDGTIDTSTSKQALDYFLS